MLIYCVVLVDCVTNKFEIEDSVCHLTGAMNRKIQGCNRVYVKYVIRFYKRTMSHL